MFKVYQGFYIICLFFFTGCMSTNKSVKQPKIQAEENIPKKIVKEKNTECIKYTKIMSYSNSYIIEEFQNGYFITKDLIGAKAQLFLIENHSQSVFAKNINKARDTYLLNYDIADSKKCDLINFKQDPIITVKDTIKNLENK